METQGKIEYLQHTSSLFSLLSHGNKRDALSSLDDNAKRQIHRPAWHAYASRLDALRKLLPSQAASFGGTEGTFHIGRSDELSIQQRECLRDAIRALIPWRKGPFTLFGEHIDTEWISSMKWDRISPLLGDLTGMRIADVGCGNGYYMLRALEHNPELVVGFDPFEKYFLQYDLIARFLPSIPAAFLLLDSEGLTHFERFFDVVMCMGVIYHERNPLRLLQLLAQSLRPGGKLIIESQAIPGDTPTSLSPPKRYAKAHNVFFVPTPSCLVGWLEKCGFVDVSIASMVPTTIEEQRATHYSPGESLKDFLDPSDSTMTIEGLPAPWRVCCVASTRM